MTRVFALQLVKCSYFQQKMMVPQNYITLSGEGDVKNMQKLIDMLEDSDDVQNVWHNWETN
nr:YebC/PmpR family DNA-binding transcriptional regulator [uncultured Dysosmobacter sp.]